MWLLMSGGSLEELRAKAERPVVYPLSRDECLALVRLAETAVRPFGGISWETELVVREARDWARTLSWQTSDPEDDGPSLDDQRSADEIETLCKIIERLGNAQSIATWAQKYRTAVLQHGSGSGAASNNGHYLDNALAKAGEL